MNGVQLSIFEDFTFTDPEPVQEISIVSEPLAASETSSDSGFGMGDILSKFDAVSIENIVLISEKDKVFCEETQEDFDAAVKLIQKAKQFYQENEMHNVFLNTESFIEDLDKKLTDKLDSFVSKIVGHFRSTYAVTIDKRKFRIYDHTVSYKDIVDDILLQMDGMNFAEKAEEEIKEAVRGTIYITSKVKVQSAKVSIADYLYFEAWFSGKFQNKRDENLRKLLQGIEFFESGAKVMRETLRELGYSYYRDDWFNEFSFPCLNKLESLKFFKNGKVELKFKTHELAIAFAKDYLKYT